jgi:Ca-activated chloride channel family protein
MDLPTFQSGLHAAWADARQFLAAVRFARPGLLWLSLVPVAVSLVAWLAARRQRGRLLALGRPGAVAGLNTMPRRTNRLAGFALVLGWWALVLGLAGPRWGKGEGEGVAVGRDVVVVLDLSRSMWAADMSSPAAPERWEAAVAGAADLTDALQQGGGHRVALVVFAARPRVVVPLTTDFDHVRHKLAELNGRSPPAEVRPADDAAASGTRIGAALAAAVEAHDPRFPGYQDVILVTDADDPADDREWQAGVTAARKAGIPVHVAGVGSPDRDSLIFRGDAPLEVLNPAGVPVEVQTRLREGVAQAIAGEARGAYLPAHQEVPRLGEFFRTRIEPHPTREVSDDLLPQPRDRSAWFLAAAAGLLLFAWLRER